MARLCWSRTWSIHSRRIEAINRSTYAFCQGELEATGRSGDAITCLQPVYDRFTEGFGTADLMAAKQLLGDLADARGR